MQFKGIPQADEERSSMSVLSELAEITKSKVSITFLSRDTVDERPYRAHRLPLCRVHEKLFGDMTKKGKK